MCWRIAADFFHFITLTSFSSSAHNFVFVQLLFDEFIIIFIYQYFGNLKPELFLPWTAILSY